MHLVVTLVLSISHCTKKWSFPLRTSPMNLIKFAGNCALIHSYGRNPQWKTSLFVQYLRLALWVLTGFIFPPSLYFRKKNINLKFQHLIFESSGRTTLQFELHFLVSSHNKIRFEHLHTFQRLSSGGVLKRNCKFFKKAF